MTHCYLCFKPLTFLTQLSNHVSKTCANPDCPGYCHGIFFNYTQYDQEIIKYFVPIIRSNQLFSVSSFQGLGDLLDHTIISKYTTETQETTVTISGNGIKRQGYYQIRKTAILFEDFTFFPTTLNTLIQDANILITKILKLQAFL